MDRLDIEVHIQTEFLPLYYAISRRRRLWYSETECRLLSDFNDNTPEQMQHQSFAQLFKKYADQMDSSDHAGDVMNWQNFFKLSVIQTAKGQEKLFFKAELKTPTQFPFNELIISQFQHLELNRLEKKKLCLGIRKILVCHDLFYSAQFEKISQHFNDKVEHSKENELVLTTQGGGIYLFLGLLKNNKLTNKKIICYTSELPLPIMALTKHPQIQFIYRPHAHSYFADFSTLWKESDLMELFELKDFKASA